MKETAEVLVGVEIALLKTELHLASLDASVTTASSDTPALINQDVLKLQIELEILHQQIVKLQYAVQKKINKALTQQLQSKLDLAKSGLRTVELKSG